MHPPAPHPEIADAFLAELHGAERAGDRGKLRLLAFEAKSFPWHQAASASVQDSLDRLEALEGAPSFRQVILFSGHRPDAAGRAQPRFPPATEAAIHAALISALEASTAGKDRSQTVGLAGGASGGDLLFHEACEALGIPSRLCLSLPPERFVALSVRPFGAGWQARFWDVYRRLGSQTATLQSTVDLPPWLTNPPGYDIWQRTNLWLLHEALTLAPRRTLLALWDGFAGDGPGGTAHMVALAPQFGVEVGAILDPLALRPPAP